MDRAQRDRPPVYRPGVEADASVFKLGARVSALQSALFVVIGVSGLLLGVDRLVDDGFAGLATTHPVAFRTLCAAFVLIAVLGLAITGAEQALIESSNVGLARFGSVLAYLGHGGTIAFFSWWLVHDARSADGNPAHDAVGNAALDAVAPIAWGVMFELVFVGTWVWIIAALLHARGSSPAFVWLSVAKATSFWFAFLALLTGSKPLILFGLGAVTFVTGPIWHAWIPSLFLRTLRERDDAL